MPHNSEGSSESILQEVIDAQTHQSVIAVTLESAREFAQKNGQGTIVATRAYNAALSYVHQQYLSGSEIYAAMSVTYVADKKPQSLFDEVPYKRALHAASVPQLVKVLTSRYEPVPRIGTRGKEFLRALGTAVRTEVDNRGANL